LRDKDRGRVGGEGESSESDGGRGDGRARSVMGQVLKRLPCQADRYLTGPAGSSVYIAMLMIVIMRANLHRKQINTTARTSKRGLRGKKTLDDGMCKENIVTRLSSQRHSV